MIPRTLHYCFGMAPDFGRRPWSLTHYVCLRSAVEHIRPAEVLFHCEYEPAGPWWDLTRPLVRVEHIQAPREIFGNPLLHTAHRADVIRLDVLLRHGGIYLDADVFVHRSFDGLLRYATVLGEQHSAGGVRGLCNAVMLAEPQASFLKKWLSEYGHFRSKGRDAFWDEHSVRVPYVLAQRFRDEVTVLPDAAFFRPPHTPEGLKKIFASREPLQLAESYATHLWESLAWERYLEGLSPGRIRAVESNFHRWARPYVETLPANYGLPAREKGFRYPLRGLKRYRSVPRRAVSQAGHALCRSAIRLLPASTLARYYRQRVFRNVYDEGAWGRAGESRYFSGVGSVGATAQAYVESMAAVLARLKTRLGKDLSVVDLGCGDFRVGSELIKRAPVKQYTGCDIVPGLVDENQRKYGSNNVEFRCLDIVSDDLPPGDVYLVRQVFQHLSNTDIARVLAKLRRCPHVFVTETQPEVLEGPANPDKHPGAGVRFNWIEGRGRGVELAMPPFNVPVEEIFRITQDPQAAREILVTWRLRSPGALDPRTAHSSGRVASL